MGQYLNLHNTDSNMLAENWVWINLSVSTEAKLLSFAHSLQFYGIRQVGRVKYGNTSTSGIVLVFRCC